MLFFNYFPCVKGNIEEGLVERILQFPLTVIAPISDGED
ncbi:hypothetical protein RintRC_0240 [Richelia intracellularis]|nr:hypothetical protein RintRC_0240 [Richelia intracellularis]